jgi:hypothetical protein
VYHEGHRDDEQAARERSGNGGPTPGDQGQQEEGQRERLAAKEREHRGGHPKGPVTRVAGRSDDCDFDGLGRHEELIRGTRATHHGHGPQQQPRRADDHEQREDDAAGCDPLSRPPHKHTDEGRQMRELIDPRVKLLAKGRLAERHASARQGNVLHLYKGGVDVLHSRFSGSSTSAPVLVRRSDGTLVRRLDFGPRSTQEQVATDVALFAQDRIQRTQRWFVEVGARVDRDGVIGRANVTPRVGSAVLLNDAGTSVLRGGVGLFYERTPSAAGAFDQFEPFVDTRYAALGGTATGASTPFALVRAPELHTSRSVTWDLSYDHRVNERWALHVGTIDRRGDRELLVLPSVEAGRGELRLSSDGRSRYREAEVGVRYTRGTRADVNLTYVRSRSRASTNAFTHYFDAVRWPIVAENAYAPSRADVPHRLLMRSRVLPTPTWLLIAVVDWRTGFPYSTVNETLDFVGPRQTRRFPRYVRTELGIEHRVRIGHLRPWVGIRVDNAFQAWLPADVQANVTSPLFGTFYNSEYRQFRIQFRFQR